jgi:hypothetical protein
MKEAFASDREALLEAINLVPKEWDQIPPAIRPDTFASIRADDGAEECGASGPQKGDVVQLGR